MNMGNYKKTPVVYQMEATECGAASLAMVFLYYGKYMPLEQIRIETGVSRDGCNAANIMRAAKQQGFECHGYRKEVSYLKEVQTPCIIHWNFNHFVVFEGFKGNVPYVNDPAVGRRKLTEEELDECFTGVVLTFTPAEDFIKEKQVHTLGSFVWSRLQDQYGVLFKLFYIGLLLMFPGLLLPLFTKIFIDDILNSGYTEWLTKLLIFMGACVVLKIGLGYYRSLLLQKLKSKLILLSGHGFLRHLFCLPMNFYDQRYAGDLVERMNNNAAIMDFFTGSLAETTVNIFAAVFYLVVLIKYSPLLSVICLASVILCLLIICLGNKCIESTAARMKIYEGMLYGAACAGLSITDSIKSSGAEQEYCSRLLGVQAKHSNMEQQMNRFQRIVDTVLEAVDKVTDVLLLFVGGILVINGQVTIGMLAAFSSLFDSFKEPIHSLVGFTRSIQTLKSYMGRIEDIEKYPQDVMYDSGSEDLQVYNKLSGNVEICNIAFGYSSLKPPLIEKFSFKLGCGESIAFVGPSGCGKSTVSKVVSGLYAPWEGDVLLDGMRLPDIPRQILNASIATVSQNITLFSGTIRDNLTMWNPAVLEEDMVAAAKDACIHDFIIQQPDGYDFVLSENASNLSGGQRQRLEIARALTTRPTILVMDEATSALDPIVEKEILDHIRMRGCTCIIIAHRLSAFRDCNQILVMRDGKIIQRGTHQSLMGESGFYRTFIQNV